MIAMNKMSFAALLAGLAVAMPAIAQKQDSDWDKIVLEDMNGVIMTSLGGDYQSAGIGKQFVIGEYMMLSGDKSKAKVVYYELDDDGDVIRKCVKDYTDPNTYIIDASCVFAAPGANTSSLGGTGVIVGAGVIGGILIETRDPVPVGPLSTGARHL